MTMLSAGANKIVACAVVLLAGTQGWSHEPSLWRRYTDCSAW